ncbi:MULTISPECIES: phytanoyl-CoA dioxygenase family protein [Streptomyces]|uniref:Phytanoyl-CoA dioxygenase family protein n=1 Tax=Streptomyces doudnae TaxID=3075536 RepID=A0ABD5EWY0_9ACTN|nr:MULTISPECIES: phytanoyl-CoA dioxygenase family protein [unclassified Streptomyces]MDT0438365.1 phytanoyl-CoA dioxygenase family protein [Streptomyces sp. DSM 41981]MYQ65515.1 phytanoyl-CoA dioxygenase family protein [Streptomyces sp. SID4950]SCE01550.1 Ectoine hydroxylase-related dioxygenase, phytanoyl-CoA dioxygenase (PhyH) family [Streptomyces sp. SolWspMP-5a-2]
MSAPDTVALVKEYRENGFAVVERLFDPSEVAELNTAITEILNVGDIASVAEVEPGDNGMARRIWSPTKQHAAFERAAASPKLLDHVEALIGHDILFHYSKLHLKAPQVGSVVDWHQDFAYYPHTNTDLVTALVYLDDTTTENSALQAVPGSHLRGLADHYVDGFFRGKVVGADAPGDEQAVPIEAPAGSVVFIHPLLLHYSSPNRSDRYRRAFLPAYRAADAYPIHFGAHAGHNEAGVKLLRGNVSDTARVEGGTWRLPLAERPFGSLFQLQEGGDKSSTGATTGYATLEEAK